MIQAMTPASRECVRSGEEVQPIAGQPGNGNRLPQTPTRIISGLWSPSGKRARKRFCGFVGNTTAAQSFTTKIVGLISKYTVGSKVTNTERGMPIPQLSLQPGRNGSVLVIGGTVSAGTAVTVQIFTMAGQLVKELRYTISSGETHNFRLDTGNLLTGSYVCRCDIGEYTVTKKFRL